MDVLVIDGMEFSTATDKHHRWEDWIACCRDPGRPKAVVVIEPPKAMVTDKGGSAKGRRKRMDQWGYEHRSWFLRAHELGAVLRQDRLFSLYLRKQEVASLGELDRPVDIGLDPRPMQNLLIPYGLVEQNDWVPSWRCTKTAADLDEVSYPCKIVGAVESVTIKVKGATRQVPRRAVFDVGRPMPGSLSACVAAEH